MTVEPSSTILPDILLSLIAGAFFVPLGFWARHVQVAPGSVPLLDSDGRSYWLLGLVLSVAVAALFQVFSRTARAASRVDAWNLGEAAVGRRVQPLPTAWILPLIVSLTSVMLVGIYHSDFAILLFAVGTMVVLALVSAARDELRVEPMSGQERTLSLYALVIHIIAFIALSMIYINKLRSLFSASAVLVLVFLLLFELTEGEPTTTDRRLVYALAGGLALGEITWVLNYWRATGWTGGAALLVCFYLVAGLILNQLRRGVTGRDLVEYGAVSAVAFGIVAAAVLR